MLSRTLGWDFYKALRANETMIVQGHQQVFSTMQQGERIIGAEGADPRSFSEGQDVPNQKMVYPTEGVFIVSSPTAIIKGARNPNAAKLFAQFMISPLAQKMIADGGVHAARIDIAPPPGQPALSEMKFIPVDLDLIEERGRELKTRFADIFQCDVATGAGASRTITAVCAPAIEACRRRPGPLGKLAPGTGKRRSSWPCSRNTSSASSRPPPSR